MRVFNINKLLFIATLLFTGSAYSSENGDIVLSLDLDGNESSIEFDIQRLGENVNLNFDDIFTYIPRTGNPWVGYRGGYYERRDFNSDYTDDFVAFAENIPSIKTICSLTVDSNNNWILYEKGSEKDAYFTYRLKIYERIGYKLKINASSASTDIQKKWLQNITNNSCNFDARLEISISSLNPNRGNFPEGIYEDNIRLIFTVDETSV